MEYEIVTYGNVRLLANVLQSIALMMGASNDFVAMMATTVAIGFLVALVTYAVAPRKLAGWYWLGSVAAVTMLMVLPKAKVQVIDRLPGCGVGGSCVIVVDDVPAALAFLASTTSRIGDRLTELFETNFANFGPVDSPELTYRRNGLMFGNKVLREAANTRFADADFHHDVVTYLDRCVAQDLADGTIKAHDLQHSTDIWATLRAGGDGGNPAVFVPMASGETVSCRKLQEDLGTQERMGAQEKAALARLGYRLNANAPVPPDSDGSAANIANSQTTQAFLRMQLGQAAHSAADTIRQHAFINAMKDAETMRGQRTGDATPVILGQGQVQAKISTNAGWITGAKVAEEAMPLIRNGIEAILYAAFPIVVLMTLVVSGKTAVKLGSSYAAVLLWIQLWPPMYAVLNFMATEASARHIAASGGSTNGVVGLTLLTSESIYENVISDMAVVGYLVTFIPVIAWSLVKGMESLAGGAIAGAAAFTGGSREAAGMASTASHSLGMVSHDQVNLAPSYRAADFSTFENGYMSRTDDMSSRNLDSWSAKSSNLGGVSADSVEAMASAKSQAASQKFATAQAQKLAYEESLQAARSQAQIWAKSHGVSGVFSDTTGRSKGTGDGASVGNRLQVGSSADKGSSTTGTVADGLTSGATNTDTRTRTDELSAGGGASVGAGATGSFAAKISKSRQEAAAVAQGGQHSANAANAAQASTGTSSADLSRAETNHSWQESLTHSEQFQKSLSDQDADTVQLNAQLQRAESFRQAYETSMQEANEMASTASFMHNNARSIAVSWTTAGADGIQRAGGIDSFVEALHHDPAAAGRMLSSAVAPRMQDGQAFGEAYGMQSVPVNDRLDQNAVERMRSEALSSAPSASGIAGRFESDAAAVRGRKGMATVVNPGGGGSGSGPGFAAGVQREMTENKDAVESNKAATNKAVVENAQAAQDEKRRLQHEQLRMRGQNSAVQQPGQPAGDPPNQK